MSRYLLVRMKWYLHCLSFVLAALKIQIKSASLVPWVIVFVPLFVCDIYSISQKVNEIKGFLRSGCVHSRVIALRQTACIIDHIGWLLGSISLSIVLQTLYYRNDDFSGFLLPLILLPLWVSTLLSTALRAYMLVAMGDKMTTSEVLKSSLRPSGYSFSLTNMLFQFTVRGAMPLLLLLRIKGIITDWSAVFSPLWVLIFMGIPLGVMSIARAPMAHMDGSKDLQKHAIQYICITAAHVILLDLAVLISLVWLTQALTRIGDTTKSNVFGHQGSFPALLILSPVILVLLMFGILQNRLLTSARNYQTFLCGVHHQDGHEALSAASKRQAVLTALKGKTLLLQSSPSLCTRLPPALCTEALERRILLHNPQDSDLLLPGSGMEDFVGVCLYACFSSGGFLSNASHVSHGSSGGENINRDSRRGRREGGIAAPRGGSRGRGRRRRRGTGLDIEAQGEAETDREAQHEMLDLERHWVGVGDEEVEVEVEDSEEILPSPSMLPPQRPAVALGRTLHLEGGGTRSAPPSTVPVQSSSLTTQSPSESSMLNRYSISIGRDVGDGEGVEGGGGGVYTYDRRVTFPVPEGMSVTPTRPPMPTTLVVGGEGGGDTAEGMRWGRRGCLMRMGWMGLGSGSRSLPVEVLVEEEVEGACAEAQESLCVVCFSKAADTCLLECGHTVLCFRCASMLARQVPNSCPLCRVPIRLVVRITTHLPLLSSTPAHDPGPGPNAPAIDGSTGRLIAVCGEGYSVNADVVNMFRSARAGRITVARTPTI